MRRFNDDWCGDGSTSVRSKHGVEYVRGESVSLAVVDAVAAVTGTHPTNLPPLAESIETDALDALFCAPFDTHRMLTFCYAGCAVTVAGDGTLTITLVE